MKELVKIIRSVPISAKETLPEAIAKALSQIKSAYLEGVPKEKDIPKVISSLFDSDDTTERDEAIGYNKAIQDFKKAIEK